MFRSDDQNRGYEHQSVYCVNKISSAFMNLNIHSTMDLAKAIG